MRRALYALAAVAGVIAVVIATLLGALLFVPESVYRDEILKAAKDATGRELTIEGDIGLTLFPVLGVKVEGVTLANAPGFSAPHVARMKALDAGVRLWPLLKGRVEITRFVLVEPQIALEVDRAGKNNWTFDTGEAAGAPAPAAAGAKEGAGLEGLSLGTLRLVDGRVSYANAQSGERWEATDINLTVALADLDSPLGVEGEARWKGERVALRFNADKPRALMEGAASPVALAVSGDLVKLSFSGEATTGETTALSGPLSLETRSLRRLVSWLSEPMAPGSTLGPFSLKGDLALKDDVAAIDGALLSLDGMTAKGRLSADTGKARPYVQATLSFDRLDLDSYLGGADEASAKPASSGSDGGGTGAAASAAPSSGWSSERLDLSGLKEADADLALSAGKVVLAGMSLSDATLNVRLRNGALTADLKNLKLYGGSGSGKISVDASGTVPALATELALTSIAIEPFLRDTTGFSRLSGTGALTLSVAGRGASERALVESLNGSGSLRLVNGAVRGINLAAMVRNIASAFGGAAAGGAQETDFAELSGSFVIQNGVLANNDLFMVNPYLRLAGAGTANIPARTVDYRFTPKLVRSSEGQGGVADLTGVSVPVRVTGSWDNLKFSPDAKGLVEGAIKGVGEALGAGQDPLKGALKGIFGLPGAKPAEAPGGGGAGTTAESPSAGSSTEGETWAPGGTKVDEGQSETAPADSAEQKPATAEDRIRNIFESILKPE